MEFEVLGTVTDTFLNAGAFSHTITVNISKEEIAKVKSRVETLPDFEGTGYRWPFEGTRAKFTSRDDLTEEFHFVWDGQAIDPHDVDQCQCIPASTIQNGRQVMIEYTVVPYVGKKTKEGDQGFLPGCSLKLLSIGLLGNKETDVDVKEGYNFESPRKKRRMRD